MAHALSGAAHARAGVRARTVELVGPAGAGKSAIAHALAAGHAGRVAPASLWGLPRPALLRQALSLLPAGRRAAAAGPRAAAQALLHLARIRALHGLVGAPPVDTAASAAAADTVGHGARTAAGTAPRAAAHAPRVLRLLDEGPVFGLAWLRMRHAGLVDGGPLEAAWREAAASWARALDAILWLDAPDAVLARRIRERGKPHAVKHASPEAIAAFSAAFRDALRAVLEAMGGDAPRLVGVSTAYGTPEAAAARIALTLALDGDGA